ncbi:hypothetical protein AAG906_008670 [Vitis piasezkii]
MMSSTQSSGLQAGTLPSSTDVTQTMQMLNHAPTQMENVIIANGFEDHIKEFQTIRKGSFTMIEYILKLKSLTDYLAAIGEPMSLHSIHSILLTHKQRLTFLNSVAKDNIISANLATPHYQHFNNKRSSNRNPSSQNR